MLGVVFNNIYEYIYIISELSFTHLINDEAMQRVYK